MGFAFSCNGQYICVNHYHNRCSPGALTPCGQHQLNRKTCVCVQLIIIISFHQPSTNQNSVNLLQFQLLISEVKLQTLAARINSTRTHHQLNYQPNHCIGRTASLQIIMAFKMQIQKLNHLVTCCIITDAEKLQWLVSNSHNIHNLHFNGQFSRQALSASLPGISSFNHSEKNLLWISGTGFVGYTCFESPTKH